MGWLVAGIVVTAGFLGAGVSIARRRFAARVAQDTRELFAGIAPSARPLRASRHELPVPVRAYLQRAIGARPEAVRTVHVLHGGTFRPKLNGSWLPIHGAQHFAADPPGFVWWGSVRVVPGIWIDAEDRSVAGLARMRIALESTLTLADSTGPALDQSALQRLLGEMVWFPTVFLDERFVTWASIDPHRARATLRLNGREATGIFAFADDDLPVSFSADRYRDLGGGSAALTPFTGEYGDYHDIDGILVPHRMDGAWNIDGHEVPYVRFRVERLEYDATASFNLWRKASRAAS